MRWRDAPPAYMDSVVKAAATDASILENPPLLPLDVALVWLAHVLSPVCYADDMGRRYGPTMMIVTFPLMRLAKMLSGNNEDVATAHAFWMANLPGGQPFDLTPANIEESKVMGAFVCPLCETKLSLATVEYAAFRLHKQTHMCASCTMEFTAEHAAVHRFLTIVKRGTLAAIAVRNSTQRRSCLQVRTATIPPTLLRSSTQPFGPCMSRLSRLWRQGMSCSRPSTSPLRPRPRTCSCRPATSVSSVSSCACTRT
ncbi:hypothetical protein AMAG_08835 [Allomyces macrogynus ATCC 38327]|uniref:Uncharacterized protein n=1 Tax=Allomyces macrogynus (strain ATCC 38327) TaxID=578462 RepID=A0A0L0SMN9_ALLM3|nr:hypothetical protein AMAG_08835 [Allomyces macrogynus ATCC 38327]|eukprot:KNE63752.1 hypothetical protein AMAG_08835 [Allomyces macrogynus ATCC 38327]